MAIVLGGVISEVMADNQTPLAKSQSEVLAAGLAERLATESVVLDKSESSPDNQGARSPASLGVAAQPRTLSGMLGKDPWGHAYRYKTSEALIIVWSGGADGKSESDASVEKLILQLNLSGHQSGQQPDKGPFRFQGDDVGFIRPIRIAHSR